MTDSRLGYDDTPSLPHCDYRVHDPDRPRPRDVEPGSAAYRSPPGDATVLFDGGSLDGWESVDGGEPGWKLTSEYVEVSPGAGDIRTTDTIGDAQLHVEWAAPSTIDGDGQGRGNSGVFLMDRYELQVLDTYDNPTYADGYAGAIYGQEPPLVHSLRPPGAWQAYDIVWRGPRFDRDSLERPATITAWCNGVLIQDAYALNGPTGHRMVPTYEPHADAAPLRLQDHGDAVRFRNIWYRPI